MTVGFIGGSGIYESLDIKNSREKRVETPFGDPSAPITIGTVADTEIAFLPRHGRNHEYSPTTVPYRANIHALKQLGVDRILSSNAVGSLREDLPPQTLVIPDQIFDRTCHRQSSFFEDFVVHMSFAQPYCPQLTTHLAGCHEATDTTVVDGGTYVCIEGPQFSTRAESEFYRANDWDVIGMTAIPEAKLAREAELCYATVTGVTDYDVWKQDEQVTLQEVLDNATANERAIKRVIERAIETLPDEHDCECHQALANAINTPSAAIPEETKRQTELLVGDYL
ncbi:S-methyl-5'-thioadenosine phosphorylase [Halocatena pleomorpha]|uniref:Purine nucleoside phosphorylase n=1 Tax=Halocatena pleomorpha TaxID=1785090 RepID=A0A3P3R3W1_9EURY|nr:S-methyl-5'-thioadenosine phosphorylase [Halocatena pleomorpha]RRJ28045.1 S-methyl-5'-thioadenosine phosphorylase [Halocatena pleomorpha]